MPSPTRWGETGRVDFSRPCGAWFTDLAVPIPPRPPVAFADDAVR